jgi:predicted nucleic acid-binding protein
MAYLLDTCAISELGKSHPDRKVRDVLLALPRDQLNLSAITIGEIQYGISLRPDSEDKTRLITWLQTTILSVFGDRILSVDCFVAMSWGNLMGELKSRGLKMQFQDSLIAATAREFGLTVVTRNEKDFTHAGISILNPWRV